MLCCHASELLSRDGANHLAVFVFVCITLNDRMEKGGWLTSNCSGNVVNSFACSKARRTVTAGIFNTTGGSPSLRFKFKSFQAAVAEG